ncbi:MAG: OmpA family protein [Nitrospiria bacterium]
MKRNLFRRFSYFGLVSMFVSSLLVMGCSKKIAPIEGTSGIAGDSVSKTPSRIVPSDPEPEREVKDPIGEERVPPAEGFSFFEEPTQGGAAEGDEPFILSDQSSPSETISSSGVPDRIQDAYFDFDQWVLQRDAKVALELNARWLEAHPEARIQIEGHGDIRGTREYNLALGERRAKGAMNFLVSLGVARSRMSFISFGEENNVCSEKNEACYKKNRRAHFVVLEK